MQQILLQCNKLENECILQFTKLITMNYKEKKQRNSNDFKRLRNAVGDIRMI